MHPHALHAAVGAVGNDVERTALIVVGIGARLRKKGGSVLEECLTLSHVERGMASGGEEVKLLRLDLNERVGLAVYLLGVGEICARALDRIKEAQS